MPLMRNVSEFFSRYFTSASEGKFKDSFKHPLVNKILWGSKTSIVFISFDICFLVLSRDLDEAGLGLVTCSNFIIGNFELVTGNNFDFVIDTDLVRNRPADLLDSQDTASSGT